MTDREPPVNEPSALWEAWLELVQLGAAHLDAVAQALGLDATALRCIGFASREPDLTPGRLAELTGLTTGAVTGVLDRLERAGFIERVPDPADRRRTIIRVALGERWREVARAYDPLEHAAQDILGELGDQDRATVASVLAKLRDAVAEDTARVRARTRGGMVGEMFTAPVGDAVAGRLVFASNAPRLALRAAPLGPGSDARMVAELARSSLRLTSATEPGELCRATFSGPVPEMRAERDGTVTCRYRTRLDWRARETTIGLSQEVPWSISITGGISAVSGDLRGVRLHAVDLSGGADQLDLELPPPDGTVRIRLSGSTARVRLVRPRGSAMRLAVSGGARDVRFGEHRSRDVHGALRLETRGAGTAPDRFEVELSGGVETLRVEEA